MSYQEKLEKLASGDIKGVRLTREFEWIAQTIATGFLYLGQIIGKSEEEPEKTEMIESDTFSYEKLPEPEPETDQPKRGRPRGSRLYPPIEPEPEE